jgi:hypothetical protein
MAAAIGMTWLVAVVAGAHEIVSGLTISGVPQARKTLTAKAEWHGSVTATTWKWQRCTAGASQQCTVINGATQPTYVLRAEDVGFERHLRAGTRLDVVVRKPERIGKWTTITIRLAAPPRRLDRCPYPGRGEPAACPAA